jgi:hypothetical protein
MAVVLAAASLSAQTSGRRMAPPTAQDSPDSLRTTLVGTIVKIENMMDRDGPMWIFLDTGEREPVKVVFASMFTRTPPSEERQELYRRVIKLKVGDRIRAGGHGAPGGFILETMIRVDAEGNPPALKLDLDEDWLLLVRQLRFGLTYADLDGMLPGLGELAPDGGVSGDLHEAKRSVRLFDYDADLEFNFKNDSLYSYYFFVRELGGSASQELYDWLQKFYTEHYAGYSEETTDEHGYSSRTSYWKGDGFTAVLTRSIQGDACSVSWGFQLSNLPSK